MTTVPKPRKSWFYWLWGCHLFCKIQCMCSTNLKEKYQKTVPFIIMYYFCNISVDKISNKHKIKMVPFFFIGFFYWFALVFFCNRVIILLHSLFDMSDCKNRRWKKTLKNLKKSIDIINRVDYNKNIRNINYRRK